MTQDEKIQLVADTIIEAMFDPREAPLDDALVRIYRKIALRVLDVLAQPSDGGVAGEPVASDCEAYRARPCPFCDSEIRHVESWARSFDPPRLYHEWHHVDDNDCWIARQHKIVASANESGERQEAALRRWNDRALPPVPGNEGREAIIHECAEIADRYDDCGGAFIAQKIRDHALSVPRSEC